LRIKRGSLKYANRTLAVLERIKSIAFVILILVLSGSVQAQKPQPPPSPTPKAQDQEPVRVFIEEVRLQIAARDLYGHYDPALELDDVLVLEDGVAQQVRSIQHLPASVLLLLDTGSQLGLKNTNTTKEIALRVLFSLSGGNRVAVMQFADQPELLQNWTTDMAAAGKTLRTKTHSGRSSRLSEAIAMASDQFKDTPAGTRHIVLITDGVDVPGGRFNLPESLKQLNSIQASVHIISYTVLSRKAIQKLNAWRKGDGRQRDGNPASNPVANGDPTLPPGTTRTPSFKLGSKDADPELAKRRAEYERAIIFSEAQLSEIAEESGGQIFIPELTSDLLSEAESISRDIGSQYVITYRPTRPLADAKSGEYRKVKVASRRVGLYLRSRQGYVVP
jgi:VWFA-related protein